MSYARTTDSIIYPSEKNVNGKLKKPIIFFKGGQGTAKSRRAVKGLPASHRCVEWLDGEAFRSEFTALKTDAHPLAPQGEEALLRKPSAAAKDARLRSLGVCSIPVGRKQMVKTKAVFSCSFWILLKGDQ